ncbi:MAG: tRNA1(Val) (adenine(37)-N6)-methyltransferase [Thermodesulfobacteriota bacterium]
MSDLTEDTFFNGAIKVLQDRHGYRFAVDAVILSHFIKSKPGDRILDLGTGCGIIPLILAIRNPGIIISGVELQSVLARLAKRNVKENNLEGRIRIFHLDMKLLSREIIGGAADLVVTNPPYRMARSGKVNPNEQKAIARHEIAITLGDLINVAHRMLKADGRFATIYPAQRTADLLSAMRDSRIEPKRLRSVHSLPEEKGKLVLVEGVKEGRRGIVIDPPLIIYEEKRRYSRELQEMLTL